MMKALSAMIAMLFLLVASAPAQGGDEVYKLQPEDVLRIQIYNDQQVLAELPVGDDGNISAPFVGIIRAAGKTTSELEKELKAKYIEKLRLREPRVSVIILKYRPIRASVGGAVNRPGTYEIRRGERLVSLLNMGGGYVQSVSDLRRATLKRKDSAELIPVDLYALFNRGDTSQDYLVQDGDTLNIPSDERNTINVLGLVQRPGTFGYREQMTVTDALAIAGGEIAGRSRLSRIQVFRAVPGEPGMRVRIPVDLVKFLSKGDISQNIFLEPNDYVVVPETNTPDLNRIGNVVSSAFFISDTLRRGIFGFRVFQ